MNFFQTKEHFRSTFLFPPLHCYVDKINIRVNMTDFEEEDVFRTGFDAPDVLRLENKFGLTVRIFHSAVPIGVFCPIWANTELSNTGF